MDMPDLNLGALTIPAFATIFGAGWLSCHRFIATPLKERLDKLETKQEQLEVLRDQEREFWKAKAMELLSDAGYRPSADG